MRSGRSRPPDLRPIKTQYFLGYAVMGSVAPFAPVFLDGRGLNDGQIGLVMSLGGLSVLLMPVIMGLLADLKLENRVLLRASFTGVATGLGLLLASHGFWWLLPAFLIYALSNSPMMSLTDGLLFSVRGLREAEGKPTPPYHRIRVYGTLGFIAPSIVLYVLMAYYKASVSVSLTCGIVVALMAVGNTLLLPRTRSEVVDVTPGPEVPDPHPSGSEGKPLPTMQALRCLMQPDVALFCLAMWLAWITTSTYYTFYPLYLTREIGVGEEWLGLISSLGVVPEIGYILAFGWLLKWLGVRCLVTLGLAAIFARVALLYAVPTLWIALGTQLLHGMTVLALFVVPPLYLNHRAEPSFRNSIQGLFAMLVFGTGRITGNVVSGQIAKFYDGDTIVVFGFSAGVAAVSMLLFGLLFRDRSTTQIEP